MNDCALSDLGYVGEIYSWWNKREADSIGKKLDRALINEDWLRCFLTLLLNLRQEEFLTMLDVLFRCLTLKRRLEDLFGFSII